MNKLDRIKQYFNTESINLNLLDFSIDILLTSLCAFILSKIYEKYGRSLSNRSSFAQNFVLLSLTTMMVISIIKSSIALSLGLVGALSIVRFRAAIKDPEELVFLFLTMAIGLGIGSGNRYITLIFFAAISLIIVIKGQFANSITQNPMFLLINSNQKLTINSINNILDKYIKHIEINRFEEAEKGVELVYSIKTESLASLDNITSDLRKLDKNIEISFTENKGIFN